MDDPFSPLNAGNDWIVLRYADILLMHAEAILAGGVETIDNTAIDSYMEVKVRAGFFTLLSLLGTRF